MVGGMSSPLTLAALLACAGDEPSPTDSTFVGVDSPAESSSDSAGPARLSGAVGADDLDTLVLLPDRAHALHVADLSGDGELDLLAGLPGYDVSVDEGAFALVLGPLEPGPLEIEGLLTGSLEGAAVGSGFVTPDLDGDGVVELVVAAKGHAGAIADQGAVFVLSSDVRSGVVESEALGAVLGAGVGEHLGQALAAGDLDGDGLDEVAIGGPYAMRDERLGVGTVVLLGMPSSDSVDVLTLSRVEGSQERAELGWALCVDDLDGDGEDDLAAVSANLDDDGAVSVHPGPLGEVTRVEDGVVLRAARSASDFTRGVQCGDLDGDGIIDLVVTVGPEHPESTQAASSFVVSGPFRDGDLADRASAVYEELLAEPLHTQGQHVLVEDLDGDGASDLIVGNSELLGPGGESSAGLVRLFYGPVSGQLGDADWGVSGEREGTVLGRAAVGVAADGGGASLLLTSWNLASGGEGVLIQTPQ